MALTISQLPQEVIWRITAFTDRKTLAILKLVSKLFADSEQLHQQLFAKEHPNLNVAQLKPSSWKELYHQRILAERNALSGFYRIESLFTPPNGAHGVDNWLFKDKQFVSYLIKGINQITLVICDLQKQNCSPFIKFNSQLFYYFLQEIQNTVYLSIHVEQTALLFKVGDQLDEILRLPVPLPVSLVHHPAIGGPFKWIFSKNSNSFELAVSFENKLHVFSIKKCNRAVSFNGHPRILASFLIDDKSLLMIDLNENNKVDVYDANTLEYCFSLKAKLNNWIFHNCQVLVKNEELILFSTYSRTYIYPLPSLSEKSQVYESASDKITYFHAQPTDLLLETSHREDLKLYHFSFSDDKLRSPRLTVFTPEFFNFAFYEFQGLPKFFFTTDKEILVLDFNFPPNFHDKEILVLHFNFTPNFVDECARTALKIRIFVGKFWSYIKFGLLALSLIVGTVYLRSVFPNALKVSKKKQNYFWK